MTVTKANILQPFLDRMPAPVVRHLTRLEDALAAQARAAGSFDDAKFGVVEASDAILEQLDPGAVELFKVCPKERPLTDGIRLSDRIFKPVMHLDDEALRTVYQAALHTLEYQLRRLKDSRPEHFGCTG
jgi:hypothetical protein